MRAFLDGWRRVLRAPGLILLLFGATVFLAALTSAVQTGGMMLAAEPLRPAEAPLTLATGDFLGFGWTTAIAAGVAGIVWTDTASAFLGIVVAAIWMLMLGGAADRLARDRRVGSAHFGAVSIVFFGRFLRLAIGVGAVYAFCFRWIGPFTNETVFIVTVALVGVVADFAVVRAVVEDRRSMVGALGASLRFLRRRILPAAILVGLNGLAFALIIWFGRVIVAPVEFSSATGMAATAIYAVALLIARLAFLASGIAFFQHELAHARYTAAPPIVWPDSPAAEAINNLRSGAGPH